MDGVVWERVEEGEEGRKVERRVGEIDRLFLCDITYLDYLGTYLRLL